MLRISVPRTFLVGLLSTATLASAQSPVAAPVQNSRPPALRIDGVEVPAEAYARWLVLNVGERQARVFGREYFAVEREARALGVEATEKECARRVDADIEERIEKAFLGRKSDWLAELERTRRTEAAVRLQREIEARPHILVEKMVAIDRVVPEQKIERDWEFEYGRLGRKYELSMTKVLVVVPSETGQTRDAWNAGREKVMAAGREKALAVRTRIVAGEEFGRVARETSDDPETRDSRGVPARGFSHFGWPRSFMDELEKLPVGAVSEPLFARGGWWVVRVEAVHETPLESVRDTLRERLEKKGPEPDEVAMVLERIRYATEVRVLPTMYEDSGDSELAGPNQPILEVDGEPVGRGEFARWLVGVQGEAMIQRFLEDFVIEREAKKVGITVTKDEIEARVRLQLEARIAEGHKGTRESWHLFLAMNGRTEESFVRTLAERTRTDLLAEKLLVRDRQVTPEDVKQRFASQYGADGERIEARWIVVLNRVETVDPDWTRDDLIRELVAAHERGRANTSELVRRARAGEDFAQLAREHSDDAPTRESGGLLVERFRADVYPEGFGAAVANLAVGEVTDALDYANSWATFQVVKRRKVTFEEVRDELAAELATLRPSGLRVNAHRNALTQSTKLELLGGLAPR